jgi:hypothetical protein
MQQMNQTIYNKLVRNQDDIKSYTSPKQSPKPIQYGCKKSESEILEQQKNNKN